MSKINFISRFTLLVLAVPLAGAMVLLPSLPFMPSAIAASKLGDLSKFKKIVADTEALVEKGDLVGAIARIKDLETSWDEVEPALKPRAAGDWHTVDKAIDRALAALRSAPLNAATCKRTLTELHALMDRIGN